MYKVMKKSLLSAIVQILGLIIAALRGALSLAKQVADLVDNGKKDDSFEPPVWMLNFESGLRYAENAIACFQMASFLAYRNDVPGAEDDVNPQQ